MNTKKAPETGWDIYRIFLAVCEAQSFSGAGRALELSHATVGRHINALEQQMGVKLFVRQNSGYTLTTAGEKLKSEVEPMASAVARARHVGPEATPKGTVRISIMPTLAHFWLMPHLDAFHNRFPDISLHMISEDQPASLRRREADLLIRIYGPGEENLVGRRIGRMGIGFYASKAYAEKHGLPKHRDEWAEHNIIGFAGTVAAQEISNWNEHVTRNAPSYLHFSSPTDRLSAVRAGLGIGLMTCLMGDAHADIMRIAPDKLYSSTELWLLVHPDLRDTPPVRAVMDFIAARAKADREMLAGR